MPRYTVAEGTQVNVDGTVHQAGDTIDLPEDQARTLLTLGVIAEKVQKKKANKK